VAIYGQIQVTGTGIGHWSATRMGPRSADPERYCQYAVEVQVDAHEQIAPVRYIGEVQHRYRDGALVLVQKVFEMAARECIKPPHAMSFPADPAGTTVEGASPPVEFVREGGITRLTRLTDGRVMCCICFDYKDKQDLEPTGDGRVWDVCTECAETENRVERKPDG
jgi:hypothetical protein